MTQYILKVAISAALIVAVSEISKRSTFIGALLASLPLVSVLGMLWLYLDTRDTARSRPALHEHLLARPSIARLVRRPATSPARQVELLRQLRHLDRGHAGVVRSNAGRAEQNGNQTMRTLISLGVCVATGFCACAFGAERIDNLTLERALELAEQNHPDFAEARANEQLANARRSQAGKLDNPEAVARIESAPLNGRTRSSAEYVAGVSQAIPLGGRLSASREVAQRELQVVEARTELRRRELHARVQGAFATALYFNAALAAFSNNLAGAEMVTRMTKTRLEAGDALSEELARAEVDELQTRSDTKIAEAAWRLAIRDLGSALGKRNAEIAALSGSLTNALALPHIEAVAFELTKSPAVSVAQSEAAAQRARVELVKAQRIPDVNFELFYRRLAETRQDAFDAGIRVPLSIFSRSGPRIREANAEAEAAEARLASTRLSQEQHFNRTLSELNGALESARLLNAEILPRARLVLTNAEVRYNAGDTSLADLLQKRRDWSATQMNYLQALREVHEAWRELRLHQGTGARN